MGKKNKGFAWHCHHGTLAELCYDYAKRARYIKKCKPQGERKLRLRLFKFIKGKLPEELIKAGQKLDRATKREDEAWKSYTKRGKRVATWSTARNRLVAARDNLKAALKKHKTKVEKLHAKECPNCPWDGKTIFPD